jgi:hypothetical protein
MLERNRLQPPRPPAPSQTNGWSDVPSSYSPSSDSPSWDALAGACAGLFASAEDYDATGILTGVDPSESCYWWMPELYTSVPAQAQSQAPAQSTAAIVAESSGETDSMVRRSGIRSGLKERLRRSGQATRRSGSRSTAAA